RRHADQAHCRELSLSVPALQPQDQSELDRRPADSEIQDKPKCRRIRLSNSLGRPTFQLFDRCTRLQYKNILRFPLTLFDLKVEVKARFAREQCSRSDKT